MNLKDLLEPLLPDYEILSNVYQRRGLGGRPAIVVNKNRFHVKNLTNSIVQVPWGVEAVWGVLTPKNSAHNSKIQKIICCSFYSKPGSQNKSELLDHISETFGLLSTKYGRGAVYFLLGR